MYHPIAEALNKELQASFPLVYGFLSEKGKRFFYPKGILQQSAEAAKQTKDYNATIGVSIHQGQPMFLNAIQKQVPNLPAKDLYLYAPVLGRPKLRELWLENLLNQNPSLKGKEISLPFVTTGITHSLSLIAKMFLDPDDQVLLPDLYWENYSLIFQTDYSARFLHYPFFNAQNGFNLQALEEKLSQLPLEKKVMLLFNFPNNPTGYSLTEKEQDQLTSLLQKFADKGLKMLVLCDDAYFGLFYQDGLAKQSLFARLVGLHKNIFAVKADGATKEFFVWGFRLGFLTFGYNGAEPKKLYPLLESKFSGMVRADISNPSHPPQSFLEKALAEKDYPEKDQKWFPILKKRFEKTQTTLKELKFSEKFTVYPFNSGYFLSIKLPKPLAEELRKNLLEKHQVGVIALSPSEIRVAFSSVEEERIGELFAKIDQAYQQLTA